MRRWWHAGPDWETPVAEVDLRVSGGFRITMRRPDGQQHRHRRVHRRRPAPPGAGSLVEVEFAERDGTTTVVLSHSGLASAESAQSHTEGWEEVLDNLGRKVLELGR